MQVGDLVKVMFGHDRVDGGSVGLIVKIEEFYLMAQKTQRAILHSGEEFPLHMLEKVYESR